MGNWEAFAEGTDRYGWPWVLEDRMHPERPEIEERGKVMIDGDWYIATPEEFREWKCLGGERNAGDASRPADDGGG